MLHTLVAATPAEATRQTEALMDLSRRYYALRVGVGRPDATQDVNLFGTAEEVVDKSEMLRDDLSTDEIMFEVNGRHQSRAMW